MSSQLDYLMAGSQSKRSIHLDVENLDGASSALLKQRSQRFGNIKSPQAIPMQNALATGRHPVGKSFDLNDRNVYSSINSKMILDSLSIHNS